MAKKLYAIVWQEMDREPDWLHVVADNLTDTRARKFVRTYLKEVDDNADVDFEYFWYTTVDQADGVGNKNVYSVSVEKK
jgi:hypothetical protein